MVELAQKEDGKWYFKTLSNEAALEKLQKYVEFDPKRLAEKEEKNESS